MDYRLYIKPTGEADSAYTLAHTFPGVPSGTPLEHAVSALAPSTSYTGKFVAVLDGVEQPGTTVVVTAVTLASQTDNVFVSFDGHSMLTRYAATSVGSVPEILAAMGAPYSDFTNYAVAGQTAVSMLNDASAEVWPAYKGTGKAHVLVVWPAINDLAAVGANVTNILSTVRSYVEAAVNAGYKVVLFTETSARGTGYTSRHAEIEGYRLQYNQAVRDNCLAWGVSYLVDLADDHRIGLYNSGLDKTYIVDGIHMNFKGRTIVSNMTKPAIVGAGKGKTGRITGDRPMSGFLWQETTNVSFVGTWNTIPLDVAYAAINNNHRVSNSPNASFSYTATTTEFQIKSVGLPNGADFTVMVDGAPAGRGTCFEEVESPSKTVWSIKGLTNVPHTVVVTIDQGVTGPSSFLCFDVIAGFVTAIVAAPESGTLTVDDSNAAFYTQAGTWTRPAAQPAFYLGDGRASITTNVGAIKKINVNARHIDLFVPSIIGAGTMEVTVTRIFDGVVMGVKTWDHNAAGVDRRSGYPDDKTPQLSFDNGSSIDCEVQFKNLGGGNNAIAIDQVGIRKV